MIRTLEGLARGALCAGAAVVFAGAAAADAQGLALPPGSALLEQQIRQRTPPGVSACAARAGEASGPVGEMQALAAARRCAPNMSGADIDGLVFLVLMSSARAQDQELRSAMASMRAASQAKQDQRQVAARKAALADAKDSIGEMSPQDQLALQMAQDRRSKSLQALSNVMKKLRDSDAAIVGNLK